MKQLIALAFILVLLSPTMAMAKGGGGGGRSSGGSRSFSSGSRSYSSPKPSAPKPSAPAKPSTPKPAAPVKPAGPSKTPTKSTPTVTKTAPVKPGYSAKGNVVGAGYQPAFRGGYTAPAGSVVYYRQNSLLDWLPLYFILTNDSHRDAIVETPGKDGAATTTTAVKEEGTDSMYVINWIITVLFFLGVFGFLVWLINKLTYKPTRYV